MDMTNGMEEIPAYKTEALRLLCHSDEFRRLMANGRCPHPSVKQLLDAYLIPWEFVPDTATDEASYVCCKVDMQSVTSTYLLQFYILVHRSLMRMPDGEPGSWADLLTIEINRLLNGNDQFGLGRAAVMPFTHYTVGSSFYGRLLSFQINDFNRFGEGL